jgi:hypothetical protein
MEAMQAEPVSKVLSFSQGKPLLDKQENLFSKNASIVRSSTRAETSAEMTLQEQLAGEQESTTVLVKLVDELNKKTKESKREFEEFNKRQQEYNRLCEQVMRLSSPGN